MRLIDADALIDNIDWDNDLQKWTLRSDPDDIPTIEAAPVVHGRWEHDSVGFDDFWKCSACGEDWFFVDDPEAEYTKVNYCPNCGARMDGDGDA